MSKYKKIYIIIPIIFILGIVITVKTISYFSTPKYSVKGLISDKHGDFSEMPDLGIYKEQKQIYNKYPAYILTNDSDFNVLKGLGVEVKYPSNLRHYYCLDLNKDECIFFKDDAMKFHFEIRNKKNEDGKTAKEFVEFLDNVQKQSNDLLKKMSLNVGTFKSELKGNKIIRSYSSKENSGGFFAMYFVNKDNIKSLIFYYLHGFKNNENKEMILKTIEESFKLKDS